MKRAGNRLHPLFNHMTSKWRNQWGQVTGSTRRRWACLKRLPVRFLRRKTKKWHSAPTNLKWWHPNCGPNWSSKTKTWLFKDKKTARAAMKKCLPRASQSTKCETQTPSCTNHSTKVLGPRFTCLCTLSLQTSSTVIPSLTRRRTNYPTPNLSVQHKIIRSDQKRMIICPSTTSASDLTMFLGSQWVARAPNFGTQAIPQSNWDSWKSITLQLPHSNQVLLQNITYLVRM